VAGEGNRLDLVVAAVQTLEDHPELNAGYGAVLNEKGQVELDAGLADGVTGRCAGVANVSVRHAIALARLVMETTPHVLLTGAGAQALGADMEQLLDTTPEQRARWEHARERGDLDRIKYGAPDYADTVGAVALDAHGGLAAGASTGGVFGKMQGRVGDSPIFGAGIYASGKAAVVGTGVGELFLRTLAAARTGRLIEEGAEPQEACETVIAHLGVIEDVTAGLLALDAKGNMGAAYRGGSMPAAGPDGDFSPVRI
jgi:beta-aspartyl-peptidase (threonine type)